MTPLADIAEVLQSFGLKSVESDRKLQFVGTTPETARIVGECLSVGSSIVLRVMIRGETGMRNIHTRSLERFKVELTEVCRRAERASR